MTISKVRVVPDFREFTHTVRMNTASGGGASKTIHDRSQDLSIAGSRLIFSCLVAIVMFCIQSKAELVMAMPRSKVKRGLRIENTHQRNKKSPK